MKKVVKLTESDLTKIIKKVINEKREPVMIDGGIGWYEMHMNKIERNLYAIIRDIENGDNEMAIRQIEFVINDIKSIDARGVK